MKPNNLDPQAYTDACWDKVKDYIEGVEEGTIVVGAYIRKVVKRYTNMVNDDKYLYRTEKVDKVFRFFSYLNIESKNRYTQFPMLPWQCFVLAFVFGFYHKQDKEKRVFREVLLFLSRKSGKTAFAAAIQLYGMLADGVVNPQSLLLANTTKQASIALNYAKDMIVHSPALKRRLMGQRNRIIFSDREKQGFCEVFSGVDPGRLDGFSPSMSILDETHNWDDNTIYAVVKTGIGARTNPLLMMVTTAGDKNNGFLIDYLRYHKSVLDGQIEDNASLAFIYQLDETDDLTDTSKWAKANPSLGHINNLEDLITTYQQAKHSYSDRYAFVTKHLNLFWDTPDTWIPQDVLRTRFIEFEESMLHGMDAYVGIDLSKSSDLTSVVVVVPVDDQMYVIPYFYMADRDENVIRKNGKDLSEWIEEGWIKKCETKTVDMDLVFDDILEISRKFNIVTLSYDPYNSPTLVSRLQEAGINCERFAQTAARFNAPLKMIEDIVYNKKAFIKNPVLLWNFSNVVLYVDQNANIKIIKNKQVDSVDGVVAFAEAVGAYLDATYGAEVMGINSYIDAYKGLKN